MNPANTEMIKEAVADSDLFQPQEAASKAERRRAESARLRDREMFRSLSACCLGGVFLIDNEGNCSDSNSRCCEILGLSSADGVSAGWTQLIVPEDGPGVVERWLGCLRRGASFSREFRLCHPQRGIRWVHLRASPTFSDKGTLLGHVATIDDITERKQADEKLLGFARRLETLHGLDKAILHIRSPALIARTTLICICKLLHCQWGCVAQFVLKSKKAKVLAVCGPGKTSIKAGTILAMKEFGFGTQADMRQGRFQWVEDVSSLPQCSLVTEHLRARRLRACLSVPLVSRERVIGVLTLAASKRTVFTDEHVETAREQADSLALAIEHAGLHEQVRANCQQLEILSRRLVQSQEDERRQIAHELHDAVGQQLTALKINLQVMASSSPAVPTSPRLLESISLVEGTIQQVRELSVTLRPLLLDDVGLVAALRWHVDRVAQRSGLAAHFVADPMPTRLPGEIEIACFRVAQESLNNVVRHARARQVCVELRHTGEELRLVVLDDGVGFDVSAARLRAVRGSSLGLLSMEERVFLVGGRFKIRSALQGGTKVHAHFPLTQSSRKKAAKASHL